MEGLILAGYCPFKNELMASDSFDSALKEIVIQIVDTECGGEDGFYHGH